MSKYVEYDSEEWKLFLLNYPAVNRADSFQEWAALNNVIINWGDDAGFMEFENEKVKLAFFLKWC